MTRQHPHTMRQGGAIGGFTEVMITLAVGAVVLGSLATMSVRQAINIRNQATALQFKRAYTAAQNYVHDEYNTLFLGANCVQCCGHGTNTLNWRDRFSDLKTRGYLSPSFPTVNNYQQTYRLWVGKVCINSSDALAAWLVTAPVQSAARAIGKADIAHIASLAGYQAGYVAYPDDRALTDMNLTGNQIGIIGAFSNWKIRNGDAPDQGLLFGTNVAPFAGYLAAPVVSGERTDVNDYLYRHDVPGQPDATKMAATLGMDGGGSSHDITGAKNILGQKLLATDTVYSGWTMDATGALQAHGSGVVQARGDITSTGGDISSTYDGTSGGNITAIGGNIGAIRNNGVGGNITAQGNITARTDAAGNGGNLAGKYVWFTPSNPVNPGTLCPGQGGALTYNAGLGDDGSILICRGTPLTWQVYKTAIKIETTCNGDIVPKSHADCKTGEIPAVALLGLNERDPVNVCAMTNRHWQCITASHGNSDTNITGQPITYSGAGAISNWPSCTGTCPYTCTPLWNPEGCLPGGLVGKRGWTQEDPTTWEFYIANYAVAYGAYIWSTDPLTLGAIPYGGDPDVPGSVWMQYNPWCQEHFAQNERDQDICLTQTPAQTVEADCAGALYFCLPDNGATPVNIDSSPIIYLNPQKWTFAITGTVEGIEAYDSKNFTVTNLGVQNTPPLQTGLTSNTNFEIRSDGCLGRQLAPNATCTITIRAKTYADGDLVPSTLNVTAGSSTQSATLTGSGSGFVSTPVVIASSWPYSCTPYQNTYTDPPNDFLFTTDKSYLVKHIIAFSYNRSHGLIMDGSMTISGTTKSGDQFSAYIFMQGDYTAFGISCDKHGTGCFLNGYPENLLLPPGSYELTASGFSFGWAYHPCSNNVGWATIYGVPLE